MTLLLLCMATVVVSRCRSKDGVLRQMKSNRSLGPSPVLNKILKEFAVELCLVLTDTYNSPLKQGYVPEQLKESLVRPLPICSPPKSVGSDLRPIALIYT